MQSSGALAIYSKDIRLSAEIGLGERCKGDSLRKSAGIIRIFQRTCSTKACGTSLLEILTASAKPQNDSQRTKPVGFVLSISCRDSWERESLLLTGDTGTESIQTDIYFLVASIDLFDVADDACTLGRHCRDEHSDTCTDIRR